MKRGKFLLSRSAKLGVVRQFQTFEFASPPIIFEVSNKYRTHQKRIVCGCRMLQTPLFVSWLNLLSNKYQTVKEPFKILLSAVEFATVRSIELL